MLEGVSRASGVGVTFVLDGETLKISGRLMEHYGEIEAAVLAKRGSPVSAAMTAIAEQNSSVAKECAAMGESEAAAYLLRVTVLNESSQTKALEVAYDKEKLWRNVSGAEISEWMGTFQGSRFIAWLAIRDNDPDKYTLDHVTRMILSDAANNSESAVIAALNEAINQASGEDLRGN